jgi:hypothetical protein
MCKFAQLYACHELFRFSNQLVSISVPCKQRHIASCLKYFFRIFFFMSTIQAFFFHWHLFSYFISNNNCRLLTTVQVFDIMFDNSAPPSC